MINNENDSESTRMNLLLKRVIFGQRIKSLRAGTFGKKFNKEFFHIRALDSQRSLVSIKFLYSHHKHHSVCDADHIYIRRAYSM